MSPHLCAWALFGCGAVSAALCGLLRRGRPLWALLAASWLFYFWWNPWTGFLLVGMTLVSWLCAGGIARARSKRRRKALLIAALAASLGCLALFKYAGFFLSIAGSSLAVQIILPVGISFYTF